MYRKEYMREYRKNHRDIINAQRRRYYAKHKEKIYEQNKEWRERNKEKILEYRKEYYKQNKDKIYEAQTEYRHAHSKEISKMVKTCKQRRYEKLKAQGITNAWSVINKIAEPKYSKKEVK